MWRPVLDNVYWMSWNLMLALVPAALAVLLFRGDARPRAGWVAGALTLVAFLPNAPYVLTDVVHLPDQLHATSGHRGPTVALLAQYAALFALGFGSYAFTVLRLERWLTARGWRRPHLLAVDIGVHLVCAVGVFLGRVWRFNSWTLLDEPDDVIGVIASGVLHPHPTTVVLVLVASGVFAMGTMVLRAVAVAGRRALI